jgi:H+/Cl- antiporter ClcA
MTDDGGAQAGDHDWTADVTDRIESVVTNVRDRTTVPATKAARAVVFGLVAGVLGAVVLFLVVVALVRVLNVYLPFHPHARRVWVVYVGAAAIFLAVGAFLWRKRKPKAR